MARIESLRMEPADNGFVVCWSECTPSASSGTFGNMVYSSHEEVFKDDESEKAMSRFKALRAAMRSKSGSAAEEKAEGESY